MLADAENTSLGIMATATQADYTRDPTRWGSAEMAAHFPGFKHLDMRTSGAVIRLRQGGSGPPLLLVHGNPQNHTCWYKVAAKLAQHYHVILLDLRARGQSPERASEFLDVWQGYATNIVAHEAIECGHYIQEEVPEKVIAHFTSFFKQ